MSRHAQSALKLYFKDLRYKDASLLMIFVIIIIIIIIIIFLFDFTQNTYKS